MLYAISRSGFAQSRVHRRVFIRARSTDIESDMGILTALLRLFWVACTGAILFFALAPGDTGGVGGASYHVLAFFVLALLTPAAFPGRSLLLIWCILILLGGAIEVAQGMMGNNRHGEWSDVITNAIAAGIGTLSYRLWRRLRTRRKAARAGPEGETGSVE